MASPSTAVLVRMLEPWLVRARVRLSRSFHDPFIQPSKNPVWVGWTVPEGGDLTVDDVEAMELLELLARVDFRAAWKLMLDITEESVYLDQVVDAAPLMGDSEAVCARYIICGLHHARTGPSLKHALRLLLLAIDPDEHSPLYYAVRQSLLQSYVDRHHQGRVAPAARVFNQRIQLKFQIEFSGLEKRVARRLMNELTTAALLTGNPDRLELYPSWQQRSNDRVSGLSEVFKLHAMTIAFASASISDSLLLSAKSIWEGTDVIVDWVEFDPTRDRLSPAVTTECFRGILGIDTEGTTPSMLSLCAEGTMIEFGAACSAVATSKSLKYVCFDIYDGDNRLFWAWIAYTMFSRDAAHKISSLRIDATELTQECVDVFESVRRAQDPLAVLWRSHNGLFGQAQSDQATPRVRAVVEVNPRTTLLLVNERGRVRSGNHVETLHIVEDSVGKQHVCVLYPGAGMCWVHRSQIICRREIELSSSSEPTNLCLEIDSSTEVSALAQVLSAVGSSQLVNCEIVGDGSVFVNESLVSRLFQACPHMRRLELESVEVANFDWVKVCGSKLRSLSLRDVKTRRQDSYNRMLSFIASPDASALVELHLQLPTTKLERMIANIERLLQRNRLMESLLLSVEYDEIDFDLKKTLAERIEKQSGEFLATQRAPLPLQSKLAFISCCDRICLNSDRDQKQAPMKLELEESRSVLDAEVIAMIFRFAAPCKRRVCGFIGPITT